MLFFTNITLIIEINVKSYSFVGTNLPGTIGSYVSTPIVRFEKILLVYVAGEVIATIKIDNNLGFVEM